MYKFTHPQRTQSISFVAIFRSYCQCKFRYVIALAKFFALVACSMVLKLKKYFFESNFI